MDRRDITNPPNQHITLWETNVPLFSGIKAMHIIIKSKDPSFQNFEEIMSLLNVVLSGHNIFTNHIQQQFWMQPFITLTQLFAFTGVFASWNMSTLSQANEKDTSSKLIMIGQLFCWGPSKINNHFLDSLWLVTASKTLWPCHSTFLTHLNLACCCGIWLL